MSLAAASNISVFAFVVLSMVGAGLTLSLRQVRESVRSKRTVLAALLANFVLIPLAAFALTRAIRLEDSVAIAVLLLGAAAGAPVLPKLVEFAAGDIAFAVGLMTLLMAGTIVSMPFVLPLLLPGARVHPWSIAKPLLFVVLPALAVGMVFRAARESLAAMLQAPFRMASNVALAALIACAIATAVSTGAGGGFTKILAVGIVLFCLCFAIGFVSGGTHASRRIAMAFGASHRSASISFLVAVESFRDPNIVSSLAIIAMLAFLVEVPLALIIGSGVRRAARA